MMVVIMVELEVMQNGGESTGVLQVIKVQLSHPLMSINFSHSLSLLCSDKTESKWVLTFYHGG